MPAAGTHSTAVVTGGSSGIGYEIARELSRRGYDLLLVSNQEQQLEACCRRISDEFGTKVRHAYLDLYDADAAIRLYERCRQEELTVDVLVNNAGVFFFGELAETGEEQVSRMIALHTTTPALLCKLFGKEMKERRYGYILNISSLSAFMPYPGIVLYHATKLFLKGFSRSLRTEMLAYNVNVTCACPGAVSTNLYKLQEKDHKKALRTGIMMNPDQLARKVVRSMFSKRALVVPGFLNRIILFFLFMVPHSVIALIRRLSRFLPPDGQNSL